MLHRQRGAPLLPLLLSSAGWLYTAGRAVCPACTACCSKSKGCLSFCLCLPFASLASFAFALLQSKAKVALGDFCLCLLPLLADAKSKGSKEKVRPFCLSFCLCLQ